MNLTLVLGACGRGAASERESVAPAFQLPTHCELHHVALHEQSVPAVYGLPSPAMQEWLGRARADFPHHGLVCFGGCMPGQSWWATTLVCDRCRESALAWERECAEAGRPISLDAARRERLWATAERMEPVPGAGPPAR